MDRCLQEALHRATFEVMQVDAMSMETACFMCSASPDWSHTTASQCAQQIWTKWLEIITNGEFDDACFCTMCLTCAWFTTWKAWLCTSSASACCDTSDDETFRRAAWQNAVLGVICRQASNLQPQLIRNPQHESDAESPEPNHPFPVHDPRLQQYLTTQEDDDSSLSSLHSSDFSTDDESDSGSNIDSLTDAFSTMLYSQQGTSNVQTRSL